MSILQDRSKNVMDGSYVAVPDMHSSNPSKNIGLKEYHNGVLIHNWYEDRNQFSKNSFEKRSSYAQDYKPFPNSKPDVLIRRRIIGSSDGIGSKNLIGHHNFDSSKNMITMYDQEINRRSIHSSFPEKRQWKIIHDAWVPEKTDHPLQDTPTRAGGLVDSRRNRLLREEDTYKSQLPHLSEYNQRYQRHSAASYMNRTPFSVPKTISTNMAKINHSMNNQTRPRLADSGLPREPQTTDVTASAYDAQFDNRAGEPQQTQVPRTLHYLGKVPTNGAMGVYSLKSFETLAHNDQDSAQHQSSLPPVAPVVHANEMSANTNAAALANANINSDLATAL